MVVISLFITTLLPNITLSKHGCYIHVWYNTPTEHYLVQTWLLYPCLLQHSYRTLSCANMVVISMFVTTHLPNITLCKHGCYIHVCYNTPTEHYLVQTWLLYPCLVQHSYRTLPCANMVVISMFVTTHLPNITLCKHGCYIHVCYNTPTEHDLVQTWLLYPCLLQHSYRTLPCANMVVISLFITTHLPNMTLCKHGCYIHVCYNTPTEHYLVQTWLLCPRLFKQTNEQQFVWNGTRMVSNKDHWHRLSVENLLAQIPHFISVSKSINLNFNGWIYATAKPLHFHVDDAN